MGALNVLVAMAMHPVPVELAKTLMNVVNMDTSALLGTYRQHLL